MAQAVDFRRYTPPNSREDLTRQINAFPTEHADAILAALALLQKLHDAGLISLASGLISTGDNIIDHLAAVADSPQAVTGLRAALILGSIVNTLDPDELHNAMQVKQKDASLFNILKGVATKEARQAAMVGVNLLNVFGRALSRLNAGER